MKEFIKKSIQLHEPERQKVIRNKFYKQLYSSGNSNFDDALNKSLLKLQENEITCLPPLKNIRDYYTRNLNLKYKNTNDDDSNIFQIYKMTFNNELFLRYDNKNKDRRILLFYKNSTLNYLKRSKMLHCDGTFYTAP
ncbi:hypothetical protein DMUE_5080 [Dictyocoela muelleri]|nr:hypothetical protein DMUE_5080 [Dictyocoela muelleri]